MRHCPKCEERFLRRRFIGDDGISVEPVKGAVEIDVCGGCSGVWLDWSEVGSLKELAQFISSTHGAAWQRDLEVGKCPVCTEKELVRLPVGAFGVDRCDDCLGLWFDGGELGPMLTDQGFHALMKALRRNPV
jgi:Zn-finger nucleic acid-binding protein